MDIVFYKFGKRPNSTKRPNVTASFTASDARFNDGVSSILNPEIRLTINENTTLNHIGCNYCYISQFGRYYYIN